MRSESRALSDAARAVGARVTSERRRRGWSGQELARRLTEAGCPMTQSVISRLETGKRQIDVGEASALASMFNLPIEAMFRAPSRRDLSQELEESLAIFDVKRRRLVRDANEVTELMRQLAATLIAANSFDMRALNAMAEVERSLVVLLDVALQIEADVQGIEPHEVPHRFVDDVT